MARTNAHKIHILRILGIFTPVLVMLWVPNALAQSVSFLPAVTYDTGGYQASSVAIAQEAAHFGSSFKDWRTALRALSRIVLNCSFVPLCSDSHLYCCPFSAGIWRDPRIWRSIGPRLTVPVLTVARSIAGAAGLRRETPTETAPRLRSPPPG